MVAINYCLFRDKKNGSVHAGLLVEDFEAEGDTVPSAIARWSKALTKDQIDRIKEDAEDWESEDLTLDQLDVVTHAINSDKYVLLEMLV